MSPHPCRLRFCISTDGPPTFVEVAPEETATFAVAIKCPTEELNFWDILQAFRGG